MIVSAGGDRLDETSARFGKEGGLVTLLEEMLKGGAGHAWTEAVRRRYEGKTQAEMRKELGVPSRCLTTAANEPVDEYFVGNGFLDLYFKRDVASGNWVLAGCHLG